MTSQHSLAHSHIKQEHSPYLSAENVLAIFEKLTTESSPSNPIFYRRSPKEHADEFYCTPVAIAEGYINRSCLHIKEEVRNFHSPLDALDEISKLDARLALFLSYEMGSLFEDVQIPKSTSYTQPLYRIVAYRSWCQINKNSIDTYGEFPFDKPVLQKILDSHSRNDKNPSKRVALEELVQYSRIPKDKYLSMVSRALGHIARGDIYQVNLSQEFSLPYTNTPQELAYSIFKKHPSRFQSLALFDDYSIISHSPELFINKTDCHLQIEPIKGTLPRSHDQQIDESNKIKLSNSSKNLSELTMIVDLERNDLSRIASEVTVSQHAINTAHSNVFHLSSLIEGKSHKSLSLLELLQAIYPCGSISGAPKISSQRIISKLENHRRNIYTGAIGMLYPKENNFDLELSVAIRTGVIANKKFTFSSGGGIVFESNPEEEYEETLAKASGLFEAWCLASSPQNLTTETQRQRE